MSKIDIKEIEEFNEMVDQLVLDIESGKVTANPLATTDKNEPADGMAVSVKETATESGEEVFTEKPVEEPLLDIAEPFEEKLETENNYPELISNVIEICGMNFDAYVDEGPILGTPKKGRDKVVISREDKGQVIFGTAVDVARILNLHPTTVRTRCSKNYIDINNNIWSYL